MHDNCDYQALHFSQSFQSLRDRNRSFYVDTVGYLTRQWRNDTRAVPVPAIGPAVLDVDRPVRADVVHQQVCADTSVLWRFYCPVLDRQLRQLRECAIAGNQDGADAQRMRTDQQIHGRQHPALSLTSGPGLAAGLGRG
jgi:hypothetical protein